MRAVSHGLVALAEARSDHADPWDIAPVSGYSRGSSWSGVQLVLDADSYADAERAKALLAGIARDLGRHDRLVPTMRRRPAIAVHGRRVLRVPASVPSPCATRLRRSDGWSPPSRRRELFTRDRRDPRGRGAVDLRRCVMVVRISGGPVLTGARRVRVYPTREAWEAGRGEGGLGSSDVAAVLGLSPYRGPWDVYADRVLGRRAEVTEAKAKVFRRGHREEPRILEDYAEETGAAVLPVAQTTIDAAALPLSVSPDAFVLVDGAWGLGEAKTDASGAGWGQSGAVIERWTPAARDLVREDYAAQCYAQMLATGLPFASLIVRRSLDDLRHFILLRDEALMATLTDRLASWWDRHVVRREPPDNDGSEACLAAKSRLYAAGDRKDKSCREALPDEVAVVSELSEVQAQLKALEAQERRLKADLADCIGAAYGIQWRGGKAIFADSQGRTTVDAAALRSAHPDVYAQVARTSDPSRSLRLYIQEK